MTNPETKRLTVPRSVATIAVALMMAACSSSSTGTQQATTVAVAPTNASIDAVPTTPPSVADTTAPERPEAQNQDTANDDTETLSVVVSPAEQPLPDSAAALITALDEAETAIRDTALSNELLDQWGRRQQSLYRHLSFNQGWVPKVLAGVDPSISAAVALNWTARENLSALVNTEELHDTLPAWRVSAPLAPDTLIGHYKSAEADTGIAWEFLAAINLIETRMGRIEGVSTAGAVGPMQFLPTTWAECCEGDPSVPADAIAGAAKYLTVRGGPENMARAIFGYNNSDYYVNAVTSYAEVMMQNERAYYGYHAWEIYFLSTAGLLRIPVGYEQLEPVPAATWLAENPDNIFGPGSD